MLLHLSVFEGLDIKGFLYFLEIWSLLLFGQIPSSIEFVLSRKCLIGVSSFLEIFFWCWIVSATVQSVVDAASGRFSRGNFFRELSSVNETSKLVFTTT
uniref:Uncharacterized protein n=1 Tax=Cucumis sativus TaxID=3659 RepID=A0A0A0L3S6_CUCSA